MRGEAGPIALSATALVHEAFLKLAANRHKAFENRNHFYGIASRLMRQILVDTARRRAAEKRAGAREIAVTKVPDWVPQPSRAILIMNDVLKEMGKADPLKAQIIEMSYFGGCNAEEVSKAVSKPVHIVRRELRLAKAWLCMQMSAADAHSPAADSKVSE